MMPHTEVLEATGTADYEVDDLPDLPLPLTELDHGVRMTPFWHGYKRWLHASGVTLYSLPEDVPRWYPPPESSQAPLPFACHVDGEVKWRDGRSFNPRFGYGQDARKRDVYIKLIEKNSMEHSINRYLLERTALFQEDVFPCVLPPVAVIDSPYDFSFLTMPRWSSEFLIETHFKTVRDVVTFMKCLLTGLSFLHDHKIAHRDISYWNVLINCYCPDASDFGEYDPVREHIQHSNRVAYALFDFNLSYQFPPDTNIRTARRPAHEGLYGSPLFHPRDVWGAPPEYDPFAFDVACLGNLFLVYFTTIISVVPQAAPLFARMTTHVLADRFTASEALQFFRDYLEHLPEGVARTAVLIRGNLDTLDDPEVYWSTLSPEQRERWRKYRVPTKSLVRRLLEWIGTLPYGWTIVHGFRRALHA